MEMSVGTFEVITTSNRGLPPEHYATRAVAKMLVIAETAPPELRMQAEAFKQAMSSVVLHAIKGAIMSDHTTVIAQLRKAGMEDAAALVFALRSD
jgi:ribosomal protein L30E